MVSAEAEEEGEYGEEHTQEAGATSVRVDQGLNPNYS